MSKEHLREARAKFLRQTLETSRKSYYPQMMENLEAVKESQRHFEVIFDNIPALIAYVDTDERYVVVNRAYEQAYKKNRTEIIGYHVRDIVGEKAYEKIKIYIDQALKGITVTYDMDFLLSDEEVRFFNSTYVPDVDEEENVRGFYVLKVDLTAKKEAEEERNRLQKKLNQAYKMESLGTLAGGIAHDFNNLLSPIIGFSDLLKDELDGDDALLEHVESIQKAANRAKAIVKQILMFSRQNEVELSPIKLQPVITEALGLLRSSIPKNIELKVNLNDNCGPVLADSAKVYQIVLNLVTNAYQSMTPDGGTLTVEMATSHLDETTPVFTKLRPGDFTVLKIRDTGAGIARNDIEKIFDPYFSTKDKDKGTGLGLSVVQGIVDSFNGEIKVYSELGQGVEISIYLPVYKSEKSTPSRSRISTLPGGTEHILIVDDEEMILEIERKMLERVGYTVNAFSNSLQGLQEVFTNGDTYDLIITDITMPVMNGIEFAAEVRGVNKKIPIILCTGFSNTIDDEECRQLGIQGILFKPVVNKELAEKVRTVLDKKSENC